MVVAPVAAVKVVPGSPEHTAAMIQLADDSGVQYRNFDSSGQQVRAPEVTPPVTPPVETDGVAAVVPPLDAPAVAADADFQPFFTEFAEKGDLTQESHAALVAVAATKGLSKELVDAYVAGQKALAASTATQEAQAAVAAQQAVLSEKAGHDAVGGKDSFDKMVSWAKTNLKAGEVAAFNAQVDASAEAAMFAIQGLNARFLKAVGSAPAVNLSGGASNSGETQGYASTAESTADINSPKYRTDPKFREQVAKRLSLTSDAVMGIRVR